MAIVSNICKNILLNFYNGNIKYVKNITSITTKVRIYTLLSMAIDRDNKR